MRSFYLQFCEYAIENWPLLSNLSPNLQISLVFSHANLLYASIVFWSLSPASNEVRLYDPNQHVLIRDLNSTCFTLGNSQNKHFKDNILEYVEGTMSEYQTFVRFLKLMSPLNYTVEGRISVTSHLKSGEDIEMEVETVTLDVVTSNHICLGFENYFSKNWRHQKTQGTIKILKSRALLSVY